MTNSSNPEVMVEHVFREREGEYWIDILVNREPYTMLGPFDTVMEREAAHADLMSMMQCHGSKEISTSIN